MPVIFHFVNTDYLALGPGEERRMANCIGVSTLQSRYPVLIISGHFKFRDI